MFTENWRYLGVEHYSTVQYAIVASLSFSIVVPAVFETAELVATFRFIDRFRNGSRLPRLRWLPIVVLSVGIVSSWSLVLWPRYTFPLTWTAIVLTLDPVNHERGKPSVMGWPQRGDWRPVVSLALGALICGWFWEMWNDGANPKWEYSVVPFDFLHVFEMPLLGVWDTFRSVWRYSWRTSF